MGQTVNLLSLTSVVRIHLPPPKRKVALGGFFFLFFSLLSLHFSLFSKEQMRLFQRKDKREKRREEVALLRKALNYIIICGIIQSEVMTNEQSFAR